jgi:lipoprotein NlpD
MIKAYKTIRLLAIPILLLLLSSCSQNYINNVEVQDRSYYHKNNRVKVRSQPHVVQEGESLYSISFRYGRDFRELAAYNSIRKPYTIVPGQKIFLDRDTYKTSNTSKNQVNKAQLSKNNVNSSLINNNINQENQYVNNGFTPSRWVWPTLGKVTTPFKDKDRFNNGIDIVVKATTPVRAAAAGKVVYQGAGLKGYGKLIIIKHSDEYLSAYAHNDWLLVNEGQFVNQGQKIAFVGQQPDKKLHFQIRKNGKPVDPMAYLGN